MLASKPHFPQIQRVALAASLATTLGAIAWTPQPVKNDRNLFMPGSQPGSVNLESAGRCDNCHGGYDPAVEPARNWRGSMMANAARDPLWLACLTVADQDSIWALGNPNAGDLCLRCHTPPGWLLGHSDPPNATALSGTDFEGVSCDSCHRMVDPLNAIRQSPELPAETDATGITEAAKTYQRDYDVLAGITLFDGSPFQNPATRLPVWFGALPAYAEAGSGQYFVDPTTPKRGPRFDADPKHQWYYSRFHETREHCATCHDVSNPVLANVVLGAGTPERQAAASYFAVERTFSEFRLSAYGQDGGAPANPKIGIARAAKCQDCHMHDVTGAACNKAGVAVRTDLALHDLTGGNTWVSAILASADATGPVYDPYNAAILQGTKYAGAKVDVAGLQGFGAALLDGRDRARQEIQMSADLIFVGSTASDLTLRIRNNAGHKLISGFPEGRRLWLNVRFYDSGDVLLGEVNPYEPLVTSQDANGNEQYVSGGVLQKTRDDLVYEAEMASSLTGEARSFHFVLATSRHKDNRIPPKGFDTTRAAERIVTPRWNGADAPDLFTAAEYAGGYDDVVLPTPAGTARWTASLYYQTTSKEYVDFLRHEIDGTGATLTSPTPSGEPAAYIVQADAFFSTLKDWGKALYDLWLHNGGSPPELVARLSSAPPPAAAIVPPGSTTLCPAIELSASPTGGSGSYTAYQWYRDGVAIGGATSSTYQASLPGSYTVTVTDSLGATSPESAPVILTNETTAPAVAAPAALAVTQTLCS